MGTSSLEEDHKDHQVEDFPHTEDPEAEGFPAEEEEHQVAVREATAFPVVAAAEDLHEVRPHLGHQKTPATRTGSGAANSIGAGTNLSTHGHGMARACTS